MSRRRLRLLVVASALLALVTAAVVAAVATGPDAAPAALNEGGELAPALQAKLAQQAKFLPAGSLNYQEGERTAAAIDDWTKHATPGDQIPSAVLAEARSDWKEIRGRNKKSSGDWRPLGPTWAKGLPNAFRDRSVYNGGTPDFSGRIAHVAIDPNCGSRRGSDSCRLWIANANGGVWRTDDALGKRPEWKYLSQSFEHNNTASIELDPNDRSSNTIWVGTGEPNACGSGCEAGVGVYKSTDGGDSWSEALGRDAFYNRAVGSIAVKPGNSSVIFAASGRAVRGVSNVCCGGVDALIPGAPHFGLYRSLNGGSSWELVHQGATALCTDTPADTVSLGGTPCSPRGARRVMIDPADPNTVYASYFARGIWRSKSNGDPGTWEQIMAPIGLTFPVFPGNNERAEFDVVRLASGKTRMYVGIGGGVVDGNIALPGVQAVAAYARFRRNDDVSSLAGGATAAAWQDLTSPAPDTPGYSSFGFCDPQCSYDAYVYVPAGAGPDTVYLSGSNRYGENNWGPNSPFCCPDNPATGRSNGRAVLVSTNAGSTFTDLTDDTTDDRYPFELHPDHHALVTNPQNWRQFFDVGDGGIVRSNGVLVDDSGDCVQPKGYTGAQLTFCQLVLSRVPERLESMNEGLRTLHFYQIDSSPHDRGTIIGGTQDNGSWERGDTAGSGDNGSNQPRGYAPDRFPNEATCRAQGANRGDDRGSGEQVWVNSNIADGGHNNFDIGDACFRQSSFQVGQLMVAYEPRNQLDMNWISDTLFEDYGNEAAPFIGPATDDPVNAHWLWAGREHVFRSTNQGRNPILTKQTHRENCNIWYGDFDLNDNGVYEPGVDRCDDWKAMGDPGPNGRLTAPGYGDRAGGTVAAVERTVGDANTVWAATSNGRVFVSKNANNATPSAVVFDRIDDEAANDPPRYPTAIYIDPENTNHAWITYSGFNAKTPGTPGHVFEVTYAAGASTFRLLDGNEPRDRIGDIPATSLAVSGQGTIYVGTDYGVVASSGDGVWREAGGGLPHMVAADLLYDPDKKVLYAATHGQGVWALGVESIENGNGKGKDERKDEKEKEKEKRKG